jgi:hypothetical protein
MAAKTIDNDNDAKSFEQFDIDDTAMFIIEQKAQKVSFFICHRWSSFVWLTGGITIT